MSFGPGREITDLITMAFLRRQIPVLQSSSLSRGRRSPPPLPHPSPATASTADRQSFVNDYLKELFTSNLEKRSAISGAMEREKEAIELNNSLVHGRGSNKAKHQVAGVSDSAIEETSEVVNGNDINGLENKSRKQGTLRKRKKGCHFPNGESIKYDDSAKHIEEGVGGICTNSQSKRSVNVELTSGVVEEVINCIDVGTSSLHVSSPGKSSKKKDQGKRQIRKKSHLESAESSGNGAMDKGQLHESAKVKKQSDEPDVDHDSVHSINQANLERKRKKKFSDLQVNINSGVQLPSVEVDKMIEPVDLAVSCIKSSKRKKKDKGVHKKNQGSGCDTSVSNIGGPLVSSYSMNILGETVVDLSSNSRVSKINNVEPESAKLEKKSDEPDVDHDSVNAINQANLGRKRKKKFSDLHVNVNSGVQLPSGEVGKLIEPVDLAVSCIRSSKRKRKDKGIHKKDQGSECGTSLSNIGGPLVSSSSMNILGETVVDLSPNSRVSKINNVEPKSAEVEKGSDEADVDHNSVHAINQANLERKRKKKFSDLKVNVISAVQLPSGEVEKLIEPVDLAVSCIKSSRRKKKDKGVHKKNQGSGCDTSVSNIGGPLVSSSSMNILGESVVDLSSNSRVSKINNVEPESAKVEKGSDEPDVDHDSVNAINQANLERKRKKKLSDLQVNVNSGVQLPSGEVGKMIEPVDLAVSCIKSSKRKGKDKGIHKKDQDSGCDTSLSNLGGPLVSSSSMNILGETVVDLSPNSRVSKIKNVEPESAELEKGSDEPDVDQNSVNAINQANLGRKRKKKLSDLQVNVNSGVQHPSGGEVGKMIDPVDLAVSCIKSSKRKRKDKAIHIKDQGSGCDTSLSNIGGPLVSSSSMNILGETVVDLSPNSRVSKINNVESESAKLEKGSEEADVDQDSVNAINQANFDRKRKKKFSDLQVNENSGVQLPSGEVEKMIEPVDLAVSCIRSSKRKKKDRGVHKKNQGSVCDTSVSNIGGPLVSSSSMNILGETLVDLSSNSRVSKINNVEPESPEVEKGSDEPDVDRDDPDVVHDSVNAINQANLERKRKKKLSDLQVNVNSGVQLPSGEVEKKIAPVDLAVSCIKSSKRKRKDKGIHKKDQGSGCDTSLSNIGGPLVSSFSMNILGETVIDLSSNSRVSKINNVEPESAEVEKGSDEPDVDHDSINAINQANLERKRKTKLSDLQVNVNSGVQLPSGEVGKMIEPVDLAVSCIKSSKRKRKDKGIHKKDQGSGCDTSLSNLGGPLVSSSSMNILGEIVVDLSSNSQVSKINNVEPESAEVEKESDEPDVIHDSVNTINQANLERKKKFSDLQVNVNSGVQLPSGEVEKMIEPVDPAVSCIKSSKRKRKDKDIHKKDQGSGCDTSVSNLGGSLVSSSSINILGETVVDLSSKSRVSKINNVEPESAEVENEKRQIVLEMREQRKHANELPPRMNILPPSNFLKKLLILDVNGILVDIVPAGTTKGIPSSRGILRQKEVHSRPFYMDFLQFCFERFNVAIWSSRTRINLTSVLNHLVGNSTDKFLFAWNQSHCTNTGFFTLENKRKPLFLKELKFLLGEDAVKMSWEKGVFNESNTLLVDDSPYKALRNQPHTAIFPHPYQFSDTNDSSLGPGGDLRVYLERLACADHVQNFVKQNPFGQAPITENHKSWNFYSKIITPNKYRLNTFSRTW